MNRERLEIEEIVRKFKEDPEKHYEKRRYINFKEKKKLIEEIIESIYKNYSFSEWTDYERLVCLEYKVLLKERQNLLDDDKELIKILGGERQDLRIFVSLVSDHFYIFNEKTTYNFSTDHWSFAVEENLANKEKSLIDEFTATMKRKGFTVLPDALANHLLSDIETEFLPKGKVKVFNVLFTDLVNI